MSSLSLHNKRIVITRAREQANAFAEKIRAHGGTPLLFPTIEFAPLENYGVLDDVLNNVRTFDWIVFMSANGVRFVAERCAALGINLRVLNDSRVAAIGTATANALWQKSVRVDFVPKEFLSSEIARELPLTRGERVLLFRADIASNELANVLSARSAQVLDVDAYRTLPARLGEIDIRDADAITFTSSSTVQNFLGLVPQLNHAQLDAIDIFCIGPVTADTARDFSLRVTATARAHTIDGLVRVMCEYYERNEFHALSRIKTADAF